MEKNKEKKIEEKKEEMTKEQAVNIMAQVCNTFRGTLQEHMTIKQAFNILNGS
jgi:hypothetical protein